MGEYVCAFAGKTPEQGAILRRKASPLNTLMEKIKGSKKKFQIFRRFSSGRISLKNGRTGTLKKAF